MKYTFHYSVKISTVFMVLVFLLTQFTKMQNGPSEDHFVNPPI